VKNFIILTLLLFSQVIQAAPPPRPTTPAALEISRGKIAGQSGVNNFGKTINADNAVATDIWDGAITTVIWVAPTVARIHDIVSSDVGDDGAPVGAGARTIVVRGLTAWDKKQVTETIILNGTTNVPTANAYVIINTMEVMTSGATSINIGAISATAQTDGTITSIITAGFGLTQQVIYGIPSIQTGFMTQCFVTARKAGGATRLIDSALLLNLNPNVQLLNFITQHTSIVTLPNSPYFQQLFNPNIPIPGPAIIKIQATSNTNDTEVSAGFDLILVDN